MLRVSHPLRCFWQDFRGVPVEYIWSAPAAKLFSYLAAVHPSVLGGVTTFLFAAVASSGVRVLAYLKWTRRDRFILGKPHANGPYTFSHC